MEELDMRTILETENRLLSTVMVAIAMVSLLATGCSDDPDDNSTDNNGTVTDTGTEDTGTEDTNTEDTGAEDTGTEDTGTDEDTSTEDTGTDASDTTDEDTSDTGTTGFAFTTGNPVDDPSMFTQVDRIGMPAVSTALISSKTNYNQASPTEDANGDFAGEIVGAVAGLHSTAIDIDSDLESLGLVPCTMDDPPSASGQCVSQDILANAGGGGPSPAALVLPDTLKINVGAAAGFPNGRALADPVIDVTLAVLLLDMSANTGAGDPQTPFIFTPGAAVGPLNPPTNDVGDGSFNDQFPYLHPAHQ
jgi:hypothetical protein